jgi:hypothetical protein
MFIGKCSQVNSEQEIVSYKWMRGYMINEEQRIVTENSVPTSEANNRAAETLPIPRKYEHSKYLKYSLRRLFRTVGTVGLAALLTACGSEWGKRTEPAPVEASVTVKAWEARQAERADEHTSEVSPNNQAKLRFNLGATLSRGSDAATPTATPEQPAVGPTETP